MNTLPMALLACGRSSPAISHFSTTYQDLDASSYTFTLINLPAGLYVFIYAGESITANAPTYSATLNGVAMTIATSASGTQGTSRQNLAIAYGVINTSGGNASVVVDFATTNVRCFLSAWRIDFPASNTPVATASVPSADSVVSSFSVTMTGAPAGSVTIAAVMCNQTGVSLTWTGMSERFDGGTPEVNGTYSAADASNSVANPTYSGTITGSPNGFAMAAASWR